jgi:5-(carboxyamino)imidazole ribonucleotide mutase
MPTRALGGPDSLESRVQMPAGRPVGTRAIGRAGALSAALRAAAILALNDAALAERLAQWRQEQSDAVALSPESHLP